MDICKQRQQLLHLSLIPGVAPARLERLLSRFSESPNKLLPNFYEFSCADFCQLGVPESFAHVLVEGLRDTTLLYQELALIERYDVSWCTLYDSEYPPLLRAIHLPPPVLYYQGELKFTEFTECTVAFVGSRATSQYGKRVVQSIVPELVAHGVVIVSGGAYGIDTIAHETAVQAGGVTVAVLGSGLLCPYPVANRKLFQKIKNGSGAVISTFPLQTSAFPGNFPARNRVISGLSHGCVVVRAAAKSGALITAKYALEQGRQVFAVPGAIDDPLSVGCHRLLAQGATLATSAADIMADVQGEIFQPALQRNNHGVVKPHVNDPLVRLCVKPRSIDELIALSGLPEDEVNDQLFALQLAGALDQNFAGLWIQT